MAVKQHTYMWFLIIICLGCIASLFLFPLSNEYDGWRQILAGCGTLLIVCWGFLLRQKNMSQRNRFLIASILLSMMAFCVLITSNMLAYRWDTRFDFTQNQQYSLSEQSISILQELDEEIEIKSFFETGSPDEQQFKMLIESIKSHSPHIRISHHDPNKEPLLAQQYDIKQLSEVVFLYKEKKQHIDSYFSEEIIISTILSLTKGVVHNVCFSTGHQELLIDEFTKGGSMRIVRDKLESQNYRARNINILQQGSIPSSCSVLVVAGPRLDLSSFEQEQIASYLVQGGNLYALIDIASAPNFVSSLERYGFVLKDNAVLELDTEHSLSGGDASYAILNTTDFAVHPTAKTLSTNILMQGMRSIEIDHDLRNQSLLELARTSPNSWAETEYQQGPIEFTPDVDIQGPVPVISIIEIDDPDIIPVHPITRELPTGSPQTLPQSITRKPGGKIILVGSSTLVLDEITQRPDLGNLDLFLNGISWMTQESAQLHARAHDHDITPLLLSPIQLRIIFLVSLICTPGVLLLGALGTWYWRKR